MNHLVVVSDVHLCESVPGDSLWMRYRQREFFPDAEFARLFDLASVEAGNEKLTVVFNGDLFDFDAPPVIAGQVRFDDAPRTEAIACEALDRILDDHPEFVASLARLLHDGRTLVFVSGNHDAQLTFRAVRDVLRARLVRAALSLSPDGNLDLDALGQRVQFRAWFYQTDDGVHIEHGNQYDRYCSFRHPTEPFTDDGRSIQPTMGSLSFRHLVARMGFFNPHVDSSFMLSGVGYLRHWARHYWGTPHSLAGVWAVGAMRIAGGILGSRQRADQARTLRGAEEYAREVGADPRATQEHASLFVPPSEEHVMAVLRELWLDRIALGTAGAAAVATVVLAAKLTTGAAVALGIAGAFAAYELAMPKLPLSDTYVHVAKCARRIAEIHKARAVVLGHTHRPAGEWEDGVFYGNSGTWSAAFHDIACTQPVDDGRPVIWLRTHDDGRLEGGLYTFRRGMLVPGAPQSAGTVETVGAGEILAQPGVQAG